MNTKDRILTGLVITVGILVIKEIRDVVSRKSKSKVIARECGDYPLPPPFDSMIEESTNALSKAKELELRKFCVEQYFNPNTSSFDRIKHADLLYQYLTTGEQPQKKEEQS